MNTAKQVNIMIGLMFVGLFGTFLYFIFDNGFNFLGVDFDGRESAAVVRQEKTNVERGAVLFSLNCRSCHGLTGQGPLERAGLPGAPGSSPFLSAGVHRRFGRGRSIVAAPKASATGRSKWRGNRRRRTS